MEAIQRATAGPTKDVRSYGRRFSLSNGTVVYDDTLTSQEEAVICGVYKIPSGMP